MKCTFQAARLDDINILKDIAKRVIILNYTPFLGAEAVRNFIESGQADKEIDNGIRNCTVLIGDGMPKGFAITKAPLLHLIMIDTVFQRSGYGSRLLQYVENMLFMRHNIIYLNSFKANTIANQFYLKNDWSIVQKDGEDETGDMLIRFEKKQRGQTVNSREKVDCGWSRGN